MPSKPTIPNWVDQLPTEGRNTFVRSQAEAETGRSPVAVQSALRRLKKRGRIVSPRRGFYVLVPPEYRATGSPPASWFIDDLMHDCGQAYYVGLLSAAAIHGAAHQQPMVFQVVTNRPTREMRAGRVTIQFWVSHKVDQMPVEQQQTETGFMRVATPETTAFDLVRYPRGAGHLSHTATVLAELAEQMDAEKLVSIAPQVRLPDVQRLGFLLEAVGESQLATPLAGWLHKQRPRTVDLRPGATTKKDVDRRWHVRPNVELELDL